MWTHRAWQPRSVPALPYYAERCNAVEGNTTFYATPAVASVEAWARQTDPSFRFVVKLPRVITHERRMHGVSEVLGHFLDAIAPLGSRLHALWIQLPPSFGPGDVPALDRFLRRAPGLYRWAVEVRHPAFFTVAPAGRLLDRTLSAVGAEWIPFDTTAFYRRPPTSDAERAAWTAKPRVPARYEALTDRPIVRYLGRDAVASTVEGWQPWLTVVADWLREGRSPTFFVHTPDDADALMLARRFHADVRALVPSLEPLPEPVIDDEPLTLF
jgi:uncharacterized protein YecE (DUF72 family)